MKTFKLYRQHDQIDCGPTCLRMVAKHHGRKYSVEKLRKNSGINREGVSLLGISEAAENIGFRTVGAKLSWEQLKEEAPLPCIVFWSQVHFVVVYKIKGKNNYLLTAPAPAPGTLYYSGILQEMQTISAGQELFLIQPESTSFFGELIITQRSFGKIAEGQQVLVRFCGYPYSEFGSVAGNIGYLSDIPVRDSLFFAKVEFPTGLSTNYGFELTPKNGMTGTAEIITQDMRLITRVYNNLTKELR